jgi:hypothetical protein
MQLRRYGRPSFRERIADVEQLLAIDDPKPLIVKVSRAERILMELLLKRNMLTREVAWGVLYGHTVSALQQLLHQVALKVRLAYRQGVFDFLQLRHGVLKMRDEPRLEDPRPAGFLHPAVVASAARQRETQGITMSEPIALQFISRRRLLRLAPLAMALAGSASLLSTSDARAQADQAPAAEASTPKKKTKSKTNTKTKKAKPADTMAPSANPPAAPKQQ